jgi:tetratricopeptide (TPR) repeat protein
MATLPDPHARRVEALGRRYEVERELGRGGMGTVYLAVDRKHGRRVAIKVLPPDVAAAVGPERFLREIGIVARLSHPNILPLHDSGQAGGVLYYVMPYVEGGSLRRRLDQAPLSVDAALAIARELADALDHAHAQGVIHRDVKPDNILLHGGHALLADFGVARAAGDGQITDSGLPLGTAAYASPEQAAGSRLVDQRSDIYSLGCVLWEMLQSSTAPGAETARDRLERRFAEPLPASPRLRAEVPSWIEPVLTRALAARPEDRYASAAELGRALTAPVAEPDGRWRRPRLRPRVLWMAIAAVSLLVTAAAVAFRPRHALILDPRGVVVAGFENRTGDTALAVLGDIASDYIARGLASTELIHDVYDARARAREAGEPVEPGPTAARTLARQVGAGTVVAARYYLEGDSLHFEAQLLDARTGRLVLSLVPAVGGLAERMRVVETLRQRVMAGLAAAASPEFDPWREGSAPPTYDAYRETLVAADAGWTFDFGRAAEHYLRAASLDTTYTAALADAVVMLALDRNCEAVDSLAGRLRSRSRPLPTAERSQVAYASAACSGDAEAVRTASQAVLAAMPRSVGATVLAAIASWSTHRPREALGILRRIDPEAMHLTGNRLAVYLDWETIFYRELGLYAEALATARAGLSRVPGATHLELDEAIALVGLGRASEAEQLAVSWLSSRAPDDRWSGQRAECVALTLSWHGHPDAGDRVLEQIIAWYQAAAADSVAAADSAAQDDSFVCAWRLYSPYFYAGRWDEARRSYQRLLARDPGSVKARAALGELAARRGDRRTAERLDAWLAGQRRDGLAAVARARIAMLLGDSARALRLLREAHARGLPRSDPSDPVFAPLLRDSAYQALYRPRE